MLLRLFLLTALALGALAYFTPKPVLRRRVAILVGLMVLYIVLKLTGVIDALVPDR